MPSAATNAAMADAPMSRARVIVFVVCRRVYPKLDGYTMDADNLPPSNVSHWKRIQVKRR